MNKAQLAAKQKNYRTRQAALGRSERTTAPLTDAEWVELKDIIKDIVSERTDA